MINYKYDGWSSLGHFKFLTLVKINWGSSVIEYSNLLFDAIVKCNN